MTTSELPSMDQMDPRDQMADPPTSDATLPTEDTSSLPPEPAEPSGQDPATETASRWDNRRVLRRVGLLGLELFVVFAGVYAAFLLARFQDARQDDVRRKAIYETLLAEVEQTEAVIHDHHRVLHDVWIKPMVEPYERGEQPYIFGVWLPTGQLSGTWEALLESGVDLLDPDFIQKVGTHRARIQFMLDQSTRAVRLSDEHITPVMEEQPYYDPATGRLRPQYAWYMDLPVYLVNNAERAIASTKDLRTEIQRRLAGQ
ncbi:MAG: hypothetical protein AAF560_09255 [Acidobacteriota bacterium]